MDEIAIIAIGTANPIYRQEQSVAAEMVANALQLDRVKKRLLKSIYKSTGIDSRYSVMSDICKSQGEYTFFPNDANLAFPSTAKRMQIYKDNALQLALQAINNCLAQLPTLEMKDITHLITISCTGMYAPGLDIEIVRELNLYPNVKRTMVNFMGCYAAFNGIKLAHSICKADPTAKVLVVSVELCTIHFQKNHTLDNIFSNAIFADGAAAVLIEANPKQKKYFNLLNFYCDLLPEHSHDMAWTIADNGFDIVLSSYIPQVIEEGMHAFTQKMLEQEAMTLNDIDFYAIHPGGLNILKACEAALNITKEHNKYSYGVLRKFGNMSSATVLFVLKAIWDDLNNEHNDKRIFSCAFGPGLTLESMVLSIVSVV